MSTLTVGNKTIEASVIKLRKGEELKARETAQSDGQDNMFFEIGNDTYVASGLGIHVHDPKQRTHVTFNGQRGEIISANNEQDDKGSMWFTAITGGLGTLVSLAGGAAMGGGSGLVLGAFGLFGVAALGGSYFWHLWANRQKAEQNLIAKHGTPV